MSWINRVSAVGLLALLSMQCAAAQMRLPPTDALGKSYLPQTGYEQAFQEQRAFVLVLLVIIALSVAANIWLTLVALRMQYTVERVAEAVRRVDLLEKAFRSATDMWDRSAQQEVAYPRASDDMAVVDVDFAFEPRRERVGWVSPQGGSP